MVTIPGTSERLTLCEVQVLRYTPSGEHFRLYGNLVLDNLIDTAQNICSKTLCASLCIRRENCAGFMVRVQGTCLCSVVTHIEWNDVQMQFNTEYEIWQKL